MKRVYFLIILCCLATAGGYAQGKKKPKPPKGLGKKTDENTSFLQKQWWLGFKAGTNLSKAVVVKHYSVIAPVNYDEKSIKKKYENFRELGAQAGIEVTFSYRNFSASLQPTYRRSNFTYTNRYEWIETGTGNANNHLVLNYEQQQKVDHLVVPLVIKYEIAGNKLKPYLQVGGYAAFLVGANKSVKISGVDNASGGVNEYTEPTNMIGAKDLFAKNHWGFVGGAGLNYHLGNVRFNFDVLYLYGMSNINSTKNRFNNDRLNGVADVLDDIKLNNLALSLGCLFPLRFLGSGFKSFDK